MGKSPVACSLKRVREPEFGENEKNDYFTRLII